MFELLRAARHSLQSGLTIAFKSGAITGLLVADLALLAITFYYIVLINLNVDNREIINALVALGFGASSISIFARLGGGIFTKGRCWSRFSWKGLRLVSQKMILEIQL